MKAEFTKISIVWIALAILMLNLSSCKDELPTPDDTYFNVIEDGTTGSLSWILANDGVLTISGNGKMPNYDYSEYYYYDDSDSEYEILVSTPWYSHSDKIKTVIIDNGVTSIGDFAFAFCSNVTDITIPNSVTSIGDAAFGNCSGLKNITISNSIIHIGVEAFVGCSGLKSITIPNSVECIETVAFIGCSEMTVIEVAADNNNYASENGVLFNKAKDTLLAYPGGKQGSYNVPNSVKCIEEGAFALCTNLTGITIHDNVTKIAEGAFLYCSGLTGITIPNGVTSVADMTFAYCSGLKSITILENLKNIGYGAFALCSAVTEITVKAVQPPRVDDSGSFYDVDRAIPVYVPQESLELYKNADVWKEFTNLQGKVF